MDKYIQWIDLSDSKIKCSNCGYIQDKPVGKSLPSQCLKCLKHTFESECLFLGHTCGSDRYVQ